MRAVRELLIRACVAAAFSLVPLTLHAQTPPPESPPVADSVKSRGVVALPAIEVVGRREGSVLRQTGTVHVVTREEMEVLRPISTEDALRRLPGINTKTEEETAIVSNIGLRGLASSEAKSLLLEDGVPVAPGLLIGNDRYFNPRIQRIERIEVLKGSSSLRFGPSTIGGVVNFLTKTPAEGLLLSGRSGSFGTHELMLEAGARSSSGAAYGGIVATHAQGDGFMEKGYRMNDVLLKGGLSAGNRHTFGLKLSWHENDANISYRGLLYDDYRSGAQYNPAPDDWYLTDRTAADLNHRYEISDRATLTSVAYWSNLRRDYWRYDVDTPSSNVAGRWMFTDALTGNNRTFDRYGADTRLVLNHRLFGLDSDAEFGMRGFYEESDDRRIRATASQDRTGTNDRHIVDAATSVAFHVHNQIRFSDRFSVTPGLRVESYEQTRRVLTSDDERASTSNTEFLPGIGATLSLVPLTQLYGGVYRAFSPAANSVALDGMTDQMLEAERSTNYELGLRGTRGAVDYEFALFRMDFQNQVVTGNSDPTLSQSNAGATLHQGAEIAIGYRLTKGVELSGNATWVPVSRFESGVNAGNRIPYSPRFLANATLDVSFGRLRASVLAHHAGEQFGDETNLREIPTNAAGGIWGGLMPGYTLLDLSAQWQVRESLAVFGALKNLTDERYITGLRQGIYVGPERNFEVGVRQAL